MEPGGMSPSQACQEHEYLAVVLIQSSQVMKPKEKFKIRSQSVQSNQHLIMCESSDEVEPLEPFDEHITNEKKFVYMGLITLGLEPFDEHITNEKKFVYMGIMI
jgi:hypothetical protein